jgi:hypothetical protein
MQRTFHTNEIVTNDLRNWLLWVRIKVGFTRFCFEFATWVRKRASML